LINREIFPDRASRQERASGCGVAGYPPSSAWARPFQTQLDGIRNVLAHANSNAAAESINADLRAAIHPRPRLSHVPDLRTIVHLLKARLDLPTSPFQQAPT
jgi:hypothetical protein